MGGDGDKKDEGTGKMDASDKKRSPFMKQMIRFISVGVYVSGICGPGFLLSIYYIFLWDPQIDAQRPPGYLRSGEPQFYQSGKLVIPKELLERSELYGFKNFTADEDIENLADEQGKITY